MHATFITLRPTQNGYHSTDNIFKCIFFNENVWISIKISLKFAFKDPINNSSVLVQIRAWRRPSDKPFFLTNDGIVYSVMHTCITLPQWVIAAVKWINLKSLGAIWVIIGLGMMTSSNRNIFNVTGHLCGEFPHKGQWRRALMFSLICAWINGWVNNGEAGDLRCHCTHDDVIVIW